MLKWIRVFKAVRALMHVVADADEDQKITAEEQRDILKVMWGGGPTEGIRGPLWLS